MRTTTNAILALSATLAGCAHTTVDPLGVPTEWARPPVEWRAVVIYQHSAEVPGPYVGIANLESSMPSIGPGKGTLYKSMRKKAAELGGNAIVLTSLDEPSTAIKAIGFMLGQNPDRRATALAIYVPGLVARAAPPPRPERP